MTLLRLAKAVVPRTLYPSAHLRRRAQRATAGAVQGGPFSGMQYLDYSIWGAYIPKLIGCYELELHPFVERLIALRPRHVIDIGGAEGYYAVGLLTRLSEAGVTVFEQLPSGRDAITELARRNSVSSRLHIEGSCEPNALARCIRETGATALIADVEGYEAELLDSAKVPGLEGLHMLIEVHDSAVKGCADLMATRFAKTHSVVRVAQRPRVIADYPFRNIEARLFPSLILRYALNEFRNPVNSWLWLEPRASHPA